jgi:leucyl aminopeptidase (aminopeptidase T)
MLPNYPEAKRRALARNVLRNSLLLHRGESVLIETWSSTLEWAESFVLEARVLGARPLLVLEDEATYWESVEDAPIANVGQVGSHEWAALKASDAHVYLWGPMDSARQDKLPPSLTNRLDATDHEWFRLVEKSGVRSVRWDLGRTNEERARRYGVDLAQWRNELIDAATVDPQPLQRDGRRVAEVLRRGREVRISHPNGTDLVLHLAGRKPKVDDGIVDEADVRAGEVVTVIPSGVTTVTVDEGYAEGTFVSNSTGVMFVRGEETPLARGTLTFRHGRLTASTFEGGGDVFRREYAKLGAGKDRPALLSVGLHPGISSIPLLFDQERGVITVAIGRNSFMGGATHTPRFLAFQSLRGGTLEVDGRTVVDGGTLP